MSQDIHVQIAAPLLVAATRRKTSRSNIAASIGDGFGAIMTTLSGLSRAPCGPPMVVYHSMIDEETPGEIEMCLPVSEQLERTSEKGETGDDGVYTKELTGGPLATVVHRGPYTELKATYGALMDWITAQNRQIAGPPRETYLNDPAEVAPEALLTKVEFPILEVGGRDA